MRASQRGVSLLIALILLAAITFLSVFWFVWLPPTAGNLVSGHRSGQKSADKPAEPLE